MPEFLSSSIAVDASGMATVLIKQNNPAMVWEVQQITVQVGPKSTSGSVGIFKNHNMVTPTSALTSIITSQNTAAIGQTAAGLPYLYIQASDEIEIIISKATLADQVTVRAQYREIDSSDPLVRGM